MFLIKNLTNIFSNDSTIISNKKLHIQLQISLSIGLVYVFFKRILGVYVIDIETGDLVFRDYDDLSYENDTIVGAAVIPGGFITMNIIGEV